MNTIEFILTNWESIMQLLLSIIGAASVFIKFFPQLDKNHKLKPVLEFIGSYVALNRTKPGLNINLSKE